MRKWLALILILSLSLTSLACGGKKEPSETKEFAQEIVEEVNFDDVEGCSMIINISVNPEIELYLDSTGKVLQAKALNSDAEKVISGLDFTDAGYDVAVQMILLGLKDQGYAGNGQAVKITPYAKDGHLADPVQIVNDIDAAVQTIEKDLKVSFNCTVEPVKVVTPGPSGSVTPATPATTPAAPTTAVNVDDQYDEVERDAAGNLIRTVMTLEDGSKVESFYDGNGQVTHDKLVKPDGRMEENFYQNGVFAKTLITETFGMTAEMIYDANGLLQKETYHHADGSEQEYEYRSNQLVREYRKDVDGSSWERFYENDLLVKEFSKDAGGNTNEVTYQIVGGQSLRLKEVMVWGGVTTTTDFSYDSAGELIQMRHTDSNGDWSNEYFEKGVLYKAERSWGSSFITYTYDANGCLVSGSGSSDTQILEEIYYPGINKLQVRTIKHMYDTFNTTKEYFDQNENLLRIEVYDPNGALIKTNYP